MRALVFDGVAVGLKDKEVPRPASGEALVRVSLAGICNTDLELIKGYMEFRGTLGHELIGVVENGPDAYRGKRVVAEINFACGRCETCAQGLSRHCPLRRVMGILNADGAFAEYVVVPVANLHVVPDSIPDEAAVFVEPLAAAFEILAQLPDIGAPMTAVVLGDGKLGLLVAQVLRTAGLSVTAVGKHPRKLAVLGQAGIATHLVSDWRPTPTDLVVDATGSGAGFAAALAALKPRGILVLKSTTAAAVPVNLAPLVINEVTVIGSRCGPFEPALRALADGVVDVQSLISAERPLRDGVEGLRLAAEADTLKVLLRP